MTIELSVKTDGMTGFIGRYCDSRITHPYKDFSTEPPTFIQAQSEPGNGGIVARVSAPVVNLHGTVEFVDQEHYLDIDERYEREIFGRSGQPITLIFQHKS